MSAALDRSEHGRAVYPTLTSAFFLGKFGVRTNTTHRYEAPGDLVSQVVLQNDSVARAHTLVGIWFHSRYNLKCLIHVSLALRHVVNEVEASIEWRAVQRNTRCSPCTTSSRATLSCNWPSCGKSKQRCDEAICNARPCLKQHTTYEKCHTDCSAKITK